MLRKESEPASALWSAEAAEDEILLNLDLSQATTTAPRDSRKLLRQAMSRYPFPAQADDNGELLRQAMGRSCPKLCYGRCPNNCPQYSNIERVFKEKMLVPSMKTKHRTEAGYAQQQGKAQSSDASENEYIGGRIKKQRSRSSMSSEKAAELLCQLPQSHWATGLQASQNSPRTVEDYSDSGMWAHDIKNNDLPEFPPVGFALSTSELDASLSAWRLPTFVPEKGRMIKEGNNGG